MKEPCTINSNRDAFHDLLFTRGEFLGQEEVPLQLKCLGGLIRGANGGGKPITASLSAGSKPALGFQSCIRNTALSHSVVSD